MTEADRVTLADIRAAAQRLRGVAVRTPMLHSRYWSELTGADVNLKAECLQRTGSFKVRGATNMIALLTPAERARGVIAVSAGNHAQGVAIASREAGIRCTVVMPENAALAKVEATQGYGATVIQAGRTFAEAAERMRAIAAERDLTIVPPFDDARIIAGQGTLGLEIAQEVPDVDMVLVPVGGGGLIAGVAVAVKALAPRARIVGVQSAAVPGAAESFRRRAAVTARQQDTIADGIAVATPGSVPLAHMLAHVDEVVTVDEEAITQTMVALLERSKLVVEGAGAVGLAALSRQAVLPKGGRVVVVLSGGNVDLNLLGRIVEHGLAHEGRYLNLRVLLPDRPGQLARVLGVIGATGANVLDVEHRRTAPQLSFGSVEVDLLLETRNPEHAQEVAGALQSSGYHADPVFERRATVHTFAADDLGG
jgi:threonine dehydratase